MKIIALVALLFSQIALAETFDYSKKWGIGGSWGYNTPVFGNPTNKGADGDQTWGLHLRYHLCASCGLEAAFTKHELSDTNSALQVTDVTYFYRLNPMAKFTPILGAGLGVVDITHNEPKNLKLGLKLRAGAEYALNKDFSLGLNVDYQHVNKMLFAANLPQHNIHAIAARANLTWYFGGAATAAAAAATALVKNVAEKDSDNDGVVDSKDKCPNTPKGTKVNAYGCAEAEKATVSLNVQFPLGKTEIDTSYDSDLKDLASFMNEHPKTKIEIQGHTDSTGAQALNQKLSDMRANSVKSYLVNQLKIDGSRVSAKGYGPSMPIADNKTEQGRKQNRRVVAVITQ